MVGGSVNGRPFREDSTSYLKTGVPCGNPQRYRSRGVVRMVPVSSSILEDQHLDVPPAQKTETEGERQFKRILDKQLNKEITIKEVMKQSRDFTKSLNYQSLTEQISGEFSLKDFQVIEQKKANCDALQECGLNEEEIKLHLQTVGNSITSQGKSKMNPAILQDKLKDIDDKILAKKNELEKPTQFRDIHYMSRHEMEIENTLKPNSSQVHFLQKLMTTEKPTIDGIHPDDPLNHLKQLEKDMFGHLKKNKRKRRKLHHNKETLRFQNPPSCTLEERIGLQSSDNETKGKDESDSEKNLLYPYNAFVPVLNSREESFGRNEENKPKLKTERPISVAVKWITDEEIANNKLSIEQIIDIPKFSNYTPGHPTKILFVKNLPKNIQTEDLQMLFGRFVNEQKSAPRIKMMQGRMRGQAFVYFEDVSIAAIALEQVNGFQMKGRPLIITFGKQDSHL